VIGFIIDSSREKINLTYRPRASCFRLKGAPIFFAIISLKFVGGDRVKKLERASSVNMPLTKTKVRQQSNNAIKLFYLLIDALQK